MYYRFLNNCFVFVISSCLFATFFSSFFSSLLFVWSIYIFLRRGKGVVQPAFSIIGLILFLWIALSIFWSDNDFVDSLIFLSEYRSFILIPVVAVAFHIYEVQKPAIVVFALGCGVALMASYGLGLGMFTIEGAELSLANRIFHGFIMSIFLFGLLVTFAELQDRRLKIMVLVMAGLVFYNVINIETGRTGYILVTVLCTLYIYLAYPLRIALMLTAGFLGLLVSFAFYLDSFGSRVLYTLENVYQFVFVGDMSFLHTSAGNRLEFYFSALKFGLESPWLGYGVGDVENLLAARYAEGDIKVLTDNVHSEYFNMLLIGGFPALIFYLAYIASLFQFGFSLKGKNRVVGWGFMGAALWLAVASVFNSTIKDFGDKQLVIIVLSWLLASAFNSGLLLRPKRHLFWFFTRRDMNE